MEYETPTSLASRLRLGREEFLQRLLTTLILDAPYPRWNTRSTPSPEGIAFLESLWVLSGFDDWPAGAPAFVDEFDLGAVKMSRAVHPTMPCCGTTGCGSSS